MSVINKAMFITEYNHLHIVIIVFCLLNISLLYVLYSGSPFMEPLSFYHF